MKLQHIAFITCLLFTGFASAQTTVFAKNDEIARFNQSKNTSFITQHNFISTVAITSSDYELICATMEQKDGIVSCKLIGTNELEVKHESWVHTHDLISIIQIAVLVELKTSTESSNEIQKQ